MDIKSFSSLEDTIVAIATPSGQGGVGIVRLSGQNAKIIAQKIFSTKQMFQHGVMNYGHVVDKHHETIDDGYAVYFQAPHSFTGEDVIEIQIHGSPYTLSKTVSVCIEQGARLAEAGEFTKRAFFNEKIDLLQAEAVSELISAQSEKEAIVSRKRLDGKLSEVIESVRKNVLAVLSELEADVDFPEENLELSYKDALVVKIDEVKMKLQHILQTYKQNEKIRDGFRVCFVGKPNSGKSSLFNVLLQDERAIVNERAGTTRDTISEEIILEGQRVKLFDTAGLRDQTTDEIEKEGMKRSFAHINNADLVCVIADAQEDIDQQLIASLHHAKEVWLLWNKMDLVPTKPQAPKQFSNVFYVSCKTQFGIQDFLNTLTQMVGAQQVMEYGGGISNDRHRSLLQHALVQIEESKASLEKGDSPDLVAFTFRQVFSSLNQLLGVQDGLEEMLSHIFSTFCIGK
ncbi:MAG: tRNA uridine-5-carboxymethylaminomethyl(34) synthesis GTPase MnmE [Bdellovibrionales bacterium]|nr:tRNA uridine-5-carboxymethylaminomethyl(34) synthesis GTPase MnmE [Bdellovibrionales bacterium]